jgi:NAD kinase
MRQSSSIVIVTRPTRLEGLRARWGTARQAKFVLRQAHAVEAERAAAKSGLRSGKQKAASAGVADFDEYDREDAQYRRTIEQLERDLDFGLPIKVLDRGYVPNYDFWSCQAVVVVGQDGLVANTAKYVGDLPIVAVNPDPQRIDGVLLPFDAAQARSAVAQVLDGKHRHRSVTLAEVELNDGQTLKAFNDFFIGCRTHVSARYLWEIAGRREPQSSSGVLVSTGAGSTGWMSSVFNMAAGVSQFREGESFDGVRLDWSDRRLLWAVREPFVSKTSRAELVAGYLDEGRELGIESLMPESGVIFSDGIESDFLPFTSGTIARIKASKQTARLVVA